jgi:PIN domain nuclease of toxin-antitoxin system
MRMLLDTHVVLWSVEAPHRLGPAARADLSDRSHEVLVSVVALWELATKRAIGKLQLDVVELVDELRSQDIDLLPVRPEHALSVADLPLHHRDPFDRMLVAQARHEGLTLVTADRRLEAYSVAVLRADA